MALNPNNYCSLCFSALDFTRPHEKHCQRCDWVQPIREREELSSNLTRVKEKPLKAWQKENAYQVKDELSYAEIEQECPKCGHGWMHFWTKQTRGADEGSTCYYQCKKCDFKKAENN